jgi:hypothetical protein
VEIGVRRGRRRQTEKEKAPEKEKGRRSALFHFEPGL